MTVIRKGLYIEMSNRSTQRVVFSAATNELDKDTFDTIWAAIGDNVYNHRDDERMQYYEIRVSPIT